ncbi:MAG TPA: ABC transporter ATP-binding protein [Streptosporangiaceae bacterium]|jgi:ABC-type lipoprotein export system ATPase subunit|nr:ABC transporter ATP-binding protein [Streptosporangiaceae bacterium]
MSTIDDVIAGGLTWSQPRPDAGHEAQNAMIFCDRLVRIFKVSGVEVQALQGLDLSIAKGEMTALVGASGSGKSTLLNILAGLDVPTGGQARVAGHDLLTMGSKERLEYWRSTVGFLWQQTSRNLMAHLTAAENVALPMQLAGLGRRERNKRTKDILGLLGVADCHDKLVPQMSGGQQQRVAVGVAIANNPLVLLADEPTGELDDQTAAEVFAALRAANEQTSATILIVTHDAAVSEHVNRTIAIRDGRISTEVLRRTAVDEHGSESLVAEQYAALDRVGRMQLPSEYIEALGLKDRVRLGLEADHVTVWSAEATPAEDEEQPSSHGRHRLFRGKEEQQVRGKDDQQGRSE